MKQNLKGIAALLVLCFGNAFYASADDLSDVEAAVEHFQQVVNRGELDALGQLVAEDFVGYVGASPIPVVGRDSFLAGQRDAMNMNEWGKTASLGRRHIRVHGNAAVVADDIGANFWKPKDGPGQAVYFNAVSTWIRQGDRWILASFISTPLPHGTMP